MGYKIEDRDQGRIFKACWNAAARSLRLNYRRAEAGGESRLFIVSGPRVYQQAWTRDVCYAAGGALLLGDFEPVRGTIETFLSHQRKDGLFPKALCPWPPYVMTAVEYLGIRLDFKAPLKPYYTSEQFVASFDSSALLAWTVLRYAQASGDWDFARRHTPALIRGMSWYEAFKREGLIDQPRYSDWQDAVAREGRVFYTNLVYWLGLKAMGEIAEKTGSREESAVWSRKAEEFRVAARRFFWDGWMGAFKNSDRIENFDTGANSLAVVWGFAGPEESERIMETLDAPAVWGILGPKVTVPDYPSSLKSLYSRFAGFSDYHDRQVWSWITAMASAAHARVGNEKRARETLLPMAQVIDREGLLGEVYDKDGQVRRWLARSECPFSWGSGMWIEALAALGCTADKAAPVSRKDFPGDFLWGAATAAYQIEGDNKGSDLWDWEGKRGWEPSGKAANSLESYEEDIRLLKELGANTYRFSMEWGRIVPEHGKPDEKALEYYGSLLECLQNAGIRPSVTIHHFTNPRWLWSRHPKGWRDAASVEDYLDYVRLLAARFGDRVDDWVTFNEPMVYIMNGYIGGHFPPGERNIVTSLPANVMPVVRNIILAHREAYRILHKGRSPGRSQVRVGIVQNISAVQPWKDAEPHRQAAWRWDNFFHWALVDAALKGKLDMDLDGISEDALDNDDQCLDFLGINYYTRVFVREFPFVLPPLHAFPFHAEVCYDPAGRIFFKLAGGRFGPGPKDELGHEDYPEGISQVVKAAWGRYRIPILITENGLADKAGAWRASFILSHLAGLKAAMDEGVQVLGYLHWSLMDNYEWGSYRPKLGLYRVDREHGFKREITIGGRAYGGFLKGR